MVGGCGQLVYWMGGARRRDWDVPDVVFLTITFPSSPLIFPLVSFISYSVSLQTNVEGIGSSRCAQILCS